MATLSFKNFMGTLTRFSKAGIVSTPSTAITIESSGNAIFGTSFGYNSLGYPGIINFADSPTDISGGVVTDAIIDGKERVENGVPYMYMIGHTGKLYKSQITAPAFDAPQYDIITPLGTLTTATSFTQGGTLEFFGTTEAIYIGHDAGVTMVNFDGTGEEFIGDVNQWVQNVPRQGLLVFNELYYTNGSTVAVINPDGQVNYMAINLKLPAEFIVKDMTLDTNSQNLIVVASNTPNTSLLATTPNINSTYGATSKIFTISNTAKTVLNVVNIPSFDQTAIESFGEFAYSFGYDIAGGILASLVDGFHKLISNLFVQAPTPNASNSNGNYVGWVTPEYSFSRSRLVASLFIYGQLDEEFPIQLVRQAQFASSLASGDILRIPWTSLVTNFQFGGRTSGYTGNLIGIGRMYISTVEYDGVTSVYKLYSYYNVPLGGNAVTGVYETQAVEKDSGVYTPTAYSAYLNATLSTGVSFKLELIGSDGNVLSGSNTTFTPATGSTLASGTISTGTSAALGVRVTNIGPNSPFINKIEVVT